MIRMDRDLLRMDLYNLFNKELGCSPEINDFLYFDGAPSIHFIINKYGSWVETKRKMSYLNEFDLNLLSDPMKTQMVQRVEKLLPIKWPYEYKRNEYYLPARQRVVEVVHPCWRNSSGGPLDISKHTVNVIVSALR